MSTLMDVPGIKFNANWRGLAGWDEWVKNLDLGKKQFTLLREALRKRRNVTLTITSDIKRTNRFFARLSHPAGDIADVITVYGNPNWPSDLIRFVERKPCEAITQWRECRARRDCAYDAVSRGGNGCRKASPILRRSPRLATKSTKM